MSSSDVLQPNQSSNQAQLCGCPPLPAVWNEPIDLKAQNDLAIGEQTSKPIGQIPLPLGQFDIAKVNREASRGQGGFLVDQKSVGLSPFAKMHGAVLITNEDIQKYLPSAHSVRSRQDPSPCKRNNYVQRDISLEIDFGRMVRIMYDPNVEQDTFVDNELGDTIHHIKENFGDAPLINAYDEAVAMSKESDKRWKEYWEEEARLRSLFEED